LKTTAMAAPHSVWWWVRRKYPCPNVIEHGLEIGGQTAFELHASTVGWMLEDEMRGVQKRAVTDA